MYMINDIYLKKGDIIKFFFNTCIRVVYLNDCMNGRYFDYLRYGCYFNYTYAYLTALIARNKK